MTCPVPWVMNAPTVGCLACGQKLEYAYTAMATTPWQVVAFENHQHRCVLLITCFHYVTTTPTPARLPHHPIPCKPASL